MAGNEWRAVRVYVSSHFDDCVGERDHLESAVVSECQRCLVPLLRAASPSEGGVLAILISDLPGVVSVSPGCSSQSSKRGPPRVASTSSMLIFVATPTRTRRRWRCAWTR